MTGINDTEPLTADQIQQARKARGWTQQRLADELAVSRPLVAAWESSSSTPSFDKQEMIRKALAITKLKLGRNEIDAIKASAQSFTEARLQYFSKLDDVNEFINKILEKFGGNLMEAQNTKGDWMAESYQPLEGLETIFKGGNSIYNTPQLLLGSFNIKTILAKFPDSLGGILGIAFMFGGSPVFIARSDRNLLELNFELLVLFKTWSDNFKEFKFSIVYEYYKEPFAYVSELLFKSKLNLKESTKAVDIWDKIFDGPLLYCYPIKFILNYIRLTTNSTLKKEVEENWHDLRKLALGETNGTISQNVSNRFFKGYDIIKRYQEAKSYNTDTILMNAHQTNDLS